MSKKGPRIGLTDEKRQHAFSPRDYAYTKNPAPTNADGSLTGPQRREQYKERKLAADAEKTEVQVAILRGKFVPLDEVLKEARTIFYGLKQAFLRLPRELAYEVSGVSAGEAEIRMDAAIEDILRELSETDFAELQSKLKAKASETVTEMRTPRGDYSTVGRPKGK